MEANKIKRPAHPLEKAGIFTRITFTWVLKIFLADYKERLNSDNIWGPYNKHKSELLGDRLEKEWKKELSKKRKSVTKQPSLLIAIVKAFKKEIFLLGLLSGIQGLSDSLLRPYLLGIMLTFFSGNSKDGDITNPLYAGCGLLLSTLFSNTLMNHYMLWAFTLGMQVRAACVSLVYRKCLRLSKSTMSEISPGQVVNLVSNDVSRFDLVAMSMNYLWTSPLLASLIAYFLYINVGLAGFTGMSVIALITGLQSITAWLTTRYRRKIAQRSDERIRLTDEILAGVQVIKLFAWEKPFIKLMEDARRRELNVVRRANYLRGYYMSFGLTTRRLALLVTLLVYVLSGNRLSAASVFVISAYFGTLAATMTGVFIRGVAEVSECRVSIKRLQTFLLRDEVENSFLTDKVVSNDKDDIKTEDANKLAIEVTNLNATWSLSSSVNTLSNINLMIRPGQLTGVIGSVGSGKSSLLHLLLKEMKIVMGSFHINGEVSYSSQEAWIFAGTVRDNILLGLPYDKKRYRQVIHVCSLERDLELFPNSDMTMVGERGAALSGGQRARINLARAVYKDADIYLLDDPLSAVDPHVSNSLFEDCIKGFLQGKTIVLATHQLLVIKDVDHIVIMQSGRIDDQGNYKDICERDHEFIQQISAMATELTEPTPRKNFTRMLSCISTRSVNVGGDELLSLASECEIREEEPEEKTTDDYTAYKGSVWYGYISSGYGILFALIYVVFLVMAQSLASATDLWVAAWTRSEESMNANSSTNIIEFEAARRNNMAIYGSLVAMLLVSAILRGQVFFTLCASCSRGLHTLITKCVLYTNMSFFNNVPSGAILNRFAKDLGATDEILPKSILDTSQVFGQVFGAIITSMIVNYWLVIPIGIFVILTCILRKYYMVTSLNLKRLENMNRSPVFTHLNTTLQGLTTIRAHGSHQYLKQEFDLHQDLHTTTLFTFLSAQQGYSYTLDLMGITYLSCVVFLFIIFNKGVYGADVGLAISQTMLITQLLQWGMRQLSEVVNLMTSVERLLAFGCLPPEENDTDKKSSPPNPWPNKGDIQFKNVSLSYEKDKSSVINEISLHINSGEKIGIVGRTGAGKSSLTAALFRTAIIDGTITIDEVNTADISLYTLRTRIAIIPQNPVLFSGNLRRNLDPFNEHPDYVLWRALDELELNELLKEGHGLDTRISDGGSNLSLGQRQLVCLARAIIKNSKIIILDEATANVDPETDALIQKIIRKKFNERTVLTIAHRLNTVMDSDKILVMDAGKVVEFDIPYLLMASNGSYLYSMVQETGKTMALQLASQAQQPGGNHLGYIESGTARCFKCKFTDSAGIEPMIAEVNDDMLKSNAFKHSANDTPGLVSAFRSSSVLEQAVQNLFEALLMMVRRPKLVLLIVII